MMYAAILVVNARGNLISGEDSIAGTEGCQWIGPQAVEMQYCRKHE